MTTAPVVKKKTHWWVWLIVGLGIPVVITAVVVGVYFGLRANDPYYYYSGGIDPARLKPDGLSGVGARKELYGPQVGLPAGQRNADVSPAIELRF